MNSKHTVIGIMAVIAILVSSSLIAADGSSAEDEVSFDKYYYNQLTPDQQVIYDVLCTLKADTVTILGSDGDHYIELPSLIGTAVYATDDLEYIKSALQADATRAWEATKLDATKGMDWAFWTWTLSDVKPTISVTSVTVSTSGPPYYVTSYTMRISVPDQFAETDFLKNAVAAVTTAVDSISVSGGNVSEMVKSINKALTNDPYKVTDTTEGHVYARTIYAIAEANASDGLYYLTSEAYSMVFKALCDKNGVPCTQVYGVNGDLEIIAWNVVCIGKNAYAVDVYTNADSSNKETWLAAGTYSTVDGNAFGKLHRAFPNSVVSGLSYDFESEAICNDGYGWPTEKDLVATLVEYAPWIIAGAICAVMAIALVVMARRGD